MNYILVIMTMVCSISSDNSKGRQVPIYDWRPIGEFSTHRACETAGMELNSNFKCLRKGG